MNYHQWWTECWPKLRRGNVCHFFDDHFPVALFAHQLTDQISKHGVFAKPFFMRAIRRSTMETLAPLIEGLKDAIQRHKEIHIPGEHYGFWIEAWKTVVLRELDSNRLNLTYSFVTGFLFELAFFDTYVTQLEISDIENWCSRFEMARQCLVCGEQHVPLDLRGEFYYRTRGYADCCFNCRVVAYPKKIDLGRAIEDFVHACAFIPPSKCRPDDEAFVSRIDHDRMSEVFRTYGRMGGVGHVVRKFGSWFKALATTAILPDGTLQTARGIKCVARDKHVCLSLAELQIDNWLYEHGIAHEKEPLYPRHTTFNVKGLRKADWRVGDTLIEFFGLEGDPRYEKKMLEKRLLAIALGLDVIELFPEDLEQLGLKLKGLP
ncbi:MAG: hypothetical protein V1798_05355 [Pseudomonadota bacterium]